MYHNETTNVWSHLIGVFIFFSLIFYILTFKDNDLYSPRVKVIEKINEINADVLQKNDEKCNNYNLKLTRILGDEQAK